jgi:hypothetical protein
MSLKLLKNVPYNLLWKKDNAKYARKFSISGKKGAVIAESKNTPHHGSGQGAAVFLYRNNTVVF